MNHHYFTENFINKENECNLDDINNSIIFNGLCTEDEVTLLSSDYWNQISFISDICLPYNKPLIKSIESIDSKVVLEKTEVILTPAVYENPLDTSLDVSSSVTNIQGDTATGRRLIIHGHICLFITYVSKNSTETLCTLNHKAPFSAQIFLPYKIPITNGKDSLDINFHISNCIKNVFIKHLTQCSICLCLTIVFKAIPSNTCYDHIITNECNPSCECNPLCCPKNFSNEYQPSLYGICSLRSLKSLLHPKLNLSLNNTNWKEILISKILTLPCNKLDICKILSVNFFTSLLCQKVIPCVVSDANDPFTIITDKKLAFEAILNLKITYNTPNNCNSIYSTHFKIPFSHLIPISSSTALIDKFQICFCIEHGYVNNLTCRDIFATILIFVKVNNIICRI